METLNTPQEFDKFYKDDLENLSGNDEEYKKVFEFTCQKGYLKGLIFMTHYHFPTLEMSNCFNICAQNNQMISLEYLMEVFEDDFYHDNLVEIDLQGLYDKGLYNIFSFVINKFKYQTLNSEIFIEKLENLKKYIESNSGYINYIITSKYLIKVNKILDMMNKIDLIANIHLKDIDTVESP